MKHSIARLSAVGVIAATTAVMAGGGVVGATSYSENNDYENKGHHSQYDNGWNKGGHDYNNRDYNNHSDDDHSGYSDRHMSDRDWNRLKPSEYMSSNSNSTYYKWRYEVTSKVSSYNATNWRSDGSNSNWTPSGDNWQNDWANWNPAEWQRNGSSYENWYSQVSSFMATYTVTVESEYRSNSNNSNRYVNY